jgi:uncharacterized membrane protein YtjA (UPF0391 family)
MRAPATVAGGRSLRASGQGKNPSCRVTGIRPRRSAVFSVIAIIAAIFRFGGIAAGAVSIAKVLFFVFLAVSIISLALGLRGRNRHAQNSRGGDA